MRENMGLFRGKRTDNGEWLYGAYHKHDTVKICLTTDDPKPKHFIIYDGFCDWGFEPPIYAHEVDPETVGECTGLRDNNGRLIFEGDIILHDRSVAVGENRHKREQAIRTVHFNRSGWEGKLLDGTSWSLNTLWGGDTFEVIGTIHDNTELIGGEA